MELTGRLVRTPELRFAGQGAYPILTMNLGVEDAEGRWNRETKKVEVGSGFYRVEIGGMLAQQLAVDLDKGDEVHVVGSLAQFTTGEGKDTKTQVRAKVITKIGGTAKPREEAPGWEEKESF